EPSEGVKSSIDVCLGWRACEPVCPSGLQFGRLLEQARDAIYPGNEQTISEKMLRETFCNHKYPNQKRMINITSLLGIYQRTGIQTFTRKLGIMKFFPDPMETMEKVLPDIPRKKQMKKRPKHLNSVKEKKKK